MIEAHDGKEPNLSVYLQETVSCDWNHPAVQEPLRDVVGDCQDETEKARRIFYYVRDNVKFALLGSGIEITASKTAQIRYGDCGSKTNFHIALLRGAGIPARMRSIMAEVSPLRGMIPGFLYYVFEKAREDFHFWPECYLSGEWIACEGMLDRALYEGGLRIGLFTREQIPTIDWDGESDLIIWGAWKTQDLGHRPSWDDWYDDFRKTIPMPRAFDRLFDLFAPSCRRQSDKVREYVST
jgi:transglutaminase-like putative cysteine protease